MTVQIPKLPSDVPRSPMSPILPSPVPYPPTQIPKPNYSS